MNDTDQQLADKIVALGIAHVNWDCWFLGNEADFARQYIAPTDHPELFVSDPRVAMAMMERATSQKHNLIIGGRFNGSTYEAKALDERSGRLYEYRNDNLPRAINEACAAALT